MDMGTPVRHEMQFDSSVDGKMRFPNVLSHIAVHGTTCYSRWLPVLDAVSTGLAQKGVLPRTSRSTWARFPLCPSSFVYALALETLVSQPHENPRCLFSVHNLRRNVPIPGPVLAGIDGGQNAARRHPPIQERTQKRG